MQKKSHKFSQTTAYSHQACQMCRRHACIRIILLTYIRSTYAPRTRNFSQHVARVRLYCLGIHMTRCSPFVFFCMRDLLHTCVPLLHVRHIHVVYFMCAPLCMCSGLFYTCALPSMQKNLSAHFTCIPYLGESPAGLRPPSRTCGRPLVCVS